MVNDIYELNNDKQLSVNIKDFSGPLDLLLQLVKDAKIEIKNILVSEVTSQFLSYMKQLTDVDMELASEYITIAATLVELKSRALLPQTAIEEETGIETPEQAFFRQLEEYKMFKEAGEKLKDIEVLDRLYKVPSDEALQTRYSPKDLTLDAMLNAYAVILARLETQENESTAPKEIVRDSFSISDRIAFVKEIVNANISVEFSELFSQDSSKNQVVVTFVAILELLKSQFMTAEQSKLFGEIILVKNPNFNVQEEIVYDELV